MISSRSAASRTSFLTPRPSLPMTSAIWERLAERISTARSERAVTPMGMPAARHPVRTCSQLAWTTGTRNTAPMVERMTFQLQGSAQPSSRTTGTSMASAVRKMVPMLPGSWTPSRISMPFFGWNSACSGSFPRNSAPWGASMGEMEAITSSGTRTMRTPSGTSARTPSDRMTVCRPGQYFTASSSNFVPSAAKRPAFRRSERLVSSFFTCCKRGFFLLLIRSSMGLLQNIGWLLSFIIPTKADFASPKQNRNARYREKSPASGILSIFLLSQNRYMGNPHSI